MSKEERSSGFFTPWPLRRLGISHSPLVRTAMSGSIAPAWKLEPHTIEVGSIGPLVPLPQTIENAFGPAVPQTILVDHVSEVPHTIDEPLTS
jgi:hypothetical protein